jgi:hypothetical protein
MKHSITRERAIQMLERIVGKMREFVEAHGDQADHRSSS